MVIIAFAPKSSKILPNIFCRKFKHCAVLVRNKHGFTMYQFSSHKNITEMLIRTRDIRILGSYGWFFVYLPCDIKQNFNPRAAWTCVDMAKRAIGMYAPFVQTPDALYKKLCN
ncbi:MAG: hypothetical protein J6S80_01055 [Alphaproteobacteria bacterium]|nr:hypothetical protein [Alphaproteobacteria bacterium]